MSANALEETLRGQLECPLCFDVFTDARQLPCSGAHNLCQMCITRIVTANSITCPLCRVQHAVPASGFPKNHLLEELTKFVNKANARD
jgi:hypothetical protein